jgi:hypothetical protein
MNVEMVFLGRGVIRHHTRPNKVNKVPTIMDRDRTVCVHVNVDSVGAVNPCMNLASKDARHGWLCKSHYYATANEIKSNVGDQFPQADARDIATLEERAIERLAGRVPRLYLRSELATIMTERS